MRKVPRPTCSGDEAFRLCVERCAVDLQQRMMAASSAISSAAREYAMRGGALEFHAIKPHDGVAPVVTTEEMVKLYKTKLVADRQVRSKVYDVLLSSPPRGVCPLCGQRVVSTLDHYLPKSSFPSLAVLPDNLVPACADCNKRKLSSCPAEGAQQTFHPYFDDWGAEQWLFARVLQGSPPALRFEVRPPDNWPPLRADRARHHLATFRLDELYSSHAAEELVGIRAALHQLHRSAGVEGVREHLAEQATSKRFGLPNSWQAATYQALSIDSWFCELGFTFIPTQ